MIHLQMQCSMVQGNIGGCALWVCMNVQGNSRVVSKGAVVIYPGKKANVVRREDSTLLGYYALAIGKGLPTSEEPYCFHLR